MPIISKKGSEKKQTAMRNAKKQALKRGKQDSDDEASITSDSSEEYETVSESESDSTYVPTKKNKKSKRSAKAESSSEEDSESESDDEEEEDSEEDDDEEEEDEEEDSEEDVSTAELQDIISKIFPSKYMTRRAKNSKKAEAAAAAKKKDKKAAAAKKGRSDKKRTDKTRRSKNKKSKESSSDEEEEDEDEEEEDDEEEGDGVYNILFAIDSNGGDDESECEYNDEEDKEECDTDDEQMFMRETFQPSVPDSAVDKENISGDSEYLKNAKQRKRDVLRSKKASKKSSVPAAAETELTDVEQEYIELVETKKQLTLQFAKKPKSKILRNAVDECDKSIKKLVRKARAKNAKTYHKLIHGEKKKRTDEIDYFRKKLSNKEQLRIMRDLKEINSHINVEKPYRLALLDSKMPSKFKATALQKLNVLRSMDPGDPEYYKIKNWVDTFMRIPFGIYRSLDVNMSDGLDVCHSFMSNAMTTLDQCVFGLNDAKLQIMQMVGQWISNPSAMGTAIAIKGPMGTGKTTLVKEGISKILGKEFAFITLGGSGDSSYLEGHSYTYEGSSWGKIVQILIDSKCMNPVIYFDELDKVSDTPRGEEIIGILTHLTDTTQNSQFHDKYFSEVDFDVSKCLFIFSYNDESKVNPILKDRMYRIQTKGYNAKEKVTIARTYLLPKIREQVNFKEEDVIIPDETIQYIVSNTALTNSEDGVRNLKRCLEIIHTKLNLFRLVKPDANIFGKEIDLEVSFPFVVTPKEVDIFIKNEETQNQSLLAMYV
jgi:ATP-dependent Lon protease